MAKIYIAGPMTGLPEFNYPAFHKAADDLRSLGNTVVNPAELFDGQLGLEWLDYMRAGLKALLDCEAIYMLKGYRQSRGAMIELNLAVQLGLPVTHEH